jgi:hypothetical protein
MSIRLSTLNKLSSRDTLGGKPNIIKLNLSGGSFALNLKIIYILEHTFDLVK